MLRDISSINLEGANFSIPTNLKILETTQNKYTKVSLIYGRNGAGKSTLAKAFRNISGEDVPSIINAALLDDQGNQVVLTEEEKKNVFVFDEDFVDSNIRIEGDGLGSIVMLGEQADLTQQIESATSELSNTKKLLDKNKRALSEYIDLNNPKCPQFYLTKIREALHNGDWPERDRKIKGNKTRTRVNDDTYKAFICLKPSKPRDDLVIAFKEKFKELESAKNGASVIEEYVPILPEYYQNYCSQFVNELLAKKIEKPDLSEREKYLLSLVTTGESDTLQNRVNYLKKAGSHFCPYCLQDLSPNYKNKLITSIEKILSNEVKTHQSNLKRLMINEIDINLTNFSELPSYKNCFDLINAINAKIKNNNSLLNLKLSNPYSPILEKANDISELVTKLNDSLRILESERNDHNKKAMQTQPIIEELTSINNEIAYYDVIDLSKQFDKQEEAKKKVENECAQAQNNFNQKKDDLDKLNAQRKNIDIAIDVINKGLKYIFFDNNRLTIKQDGDFYTLFSNGRPVLPKNVSVGERNILGLCYFFTKIMQEKSEKTAYTDEYLIVIDDPISSFDTEKKIGILSFLRYKLGQYLSGNEYSRAIVMTHDLLTMYDLQKICKDFSEQIVTPSGISSKEKSKFLYQELQNCQLSEFNIGSRQEYTELINIIFDYACGNTDEYDLTIGNVMRQALEAFSTFEYKKGIDTVSTDDKILDSSNMDEDEKLYFKNLMYRIVLNSGSHRKEQTEVLELNFFSLISKKEKIRTGQDILCFIYLLNKPHLLAHLGDSAEATLNTWCNNIKVRATLIA